MKILLNPTQLTCTITIGDWPPAKGVQKLIGFSRGLSFHRVDYFPYWHISNSIVLGYNRSENEDTVRIWAYGYVKGEHFQHLLCEVKPKTEIDAELRYNEHVCAAHVKEKRYSWPNYAKVIPTGFKTLPLGFQLFPYAEIDGTDIQTPLMVDIKDLKINGKMIKIK